jgi:nicotinamide-nucleotide amidase
MKNILAEVITIGDEILFGQITDTNTQYIGEELTKIGIRPTRKSSIGDTEEAILQILKEASSRADVIIMTGGLGPTKDDITKHTIAKFFNVGMVVHEPTLDQLKDFFAKRGREMIEINKRQADVPANCEVLLNKMGTAPGMWIEDKGKIYISMPGVPYEMKHIMETGAIGKLKAYFKAPVILHKMIHTIGIGESFLAQMIEHWEDALPPYMRLAYLPSLSSVKLRITTTGENPEKLQKEVDAQVVTLQKLIEPYIFGYDGNGKIEAVVGQLLLAKGLSISTAESCTGGYISHLITSIPGSSAYYKGSIISYANEVKMSELGVQASTLETHGAVSEEIVKEMAEGARKRLGTDVAISTSGIAGPDGGTEEKPVGTVWVGYSDKDKTIAKKFTFGTNRENNIKYSAMQALNFLRQSL